MGRANSLLTHLQRVFRMTERVRFDWYRRWLEQAQRMQPGTRMPSIFTDGKSLMTQVLGGDADAQAEALRAYLALGKNLPLPDGLEPPRGLVLTVKERPIMLRTFMPDAAARAMAVGYPGGVSVAFDLARCRLAYAWSGRFLDASPVWNDRGGNPAKVLGPRFWTAPAGCPWAIHDSHEPPDFLAQAKDPCYGATPPEGRMHDGPHHLHFESYSVDKSGSPSFHYRLQTNAERFLQISERIEPLRSPLAVGLARHFTLACPAGTSAWLFAGQARNKPRVVETSNLPAARDVEGGQTDFEAAGRWLLIPQDDGRLAVLELAAGPDGTSWTLRQAEGQWQALLRVPVSPGKSKPDVILSIWILPRNDAALLKELVRLK